MSSYNGTADRPDKAKAIAGVAAVHVALAAIILAGLNVRIVNRAVERLTTINIAAPKPPPPTKPPLHAKPQRMEKEAGAPAKKAEAAPIVAPPARFPLPSPLPAAKVAGIGTASSSGGAASGNGTGARGYGTGGGGTGGFTPARRMSKIPDREYRRLSETGFPSGSVGVTIKVNSDGSVGNCRIARSSGDRSVDTLMCDLTLRYVRFDPARDPGGRPVAQDVTFYPNWWRP